MIANKKGILILLLAFLLLLSACNAPSPTEQSPVVVEAQSTITPEISSEEAMYRTLIPYVANKSKGTVVSANARLDMNNQELGLLELAQVQFSPSDFLFQEGQMISRDDAEDWLGRYHPEKNMLGLNPETGSNRLIHILEHDFVHMNNQELGGIVLSLAVATVVRNAEDKEVRVGLEELQVEVQGFAQRIVERIRAKGVEAPIVVAGYALEPSASVLPGNFITFGTAAKGDTTIAKWNPIAERHIILPGRNITTDRESDIARQFADFQKEVQAFFPHYAGITGLVRFVADEPKELTITVRASYSSRTEVIAFTQYTSALISEYFTDAMKISVYVESVNRAEAIYIRPLTGEPFFYVYR